MRDHYPDQPSPPDYFLERPGCESLPPCDLPKKHTKKRIYINWTFFDAGPPPTIYCDRCGKREELNLPKSIDEFVQLTDEFDAEHSRCMPDVPNPEESNDGNG